MILNRNQIIILGLLIHLVTAFLSVGFHHADELFQIYEFAGYKLGLNSANELPWEFGVRMRPAIQPFVVVAFTKFFNTISITNPFVIATIIRCLQSVFSFWAVVQLTSFFEQKIKDEKFKMGLWFLSMFFWCLPYFHARFSSENLSTSLFITALPFLVKNTSRVFSVLWWGFILGLSVVVRFHMAFMVFGLLLWMVVIERVIFKRILVLLLGIAIAQFLGVLIDRWFYNEWVFTSWNYIYQNLFMNMAEQFGTQPFYFYITESFLLLIPPFSIVILVAFLVNIIQFPKDCLTWIVVPFILVHCMIAHKEMRFLFPVLNFLPVWIIQLLQIIKQKETWYKRLLFSKTFINSFLMVNIFLLVYFVFKPADDNTKALSKIYALGEKKSVMLLYKENNPYNNNASLHYFRSSKVVPKQLGINRSDLECEGVYYFEEEFSTDNYKIIGNKSFSKTCSNFPDWMENLNFNGWLDRVYAYSIYKCDGK